MGSSGAVCEAAEVPFHPTLLDLNNPLKMDLERERERGWFDLLGLRTWLAGLAQPLRPAGGTF